MKKIKYLLKSSNKPVFIPKKVELKLLLIEKNLKNLEQKNQNIQNKQQKYKRRNKKKKMPHLTLTNS